MFKQVDPKPNFVELEKKWLKYWYKKGIVKKYLQKNKTSKKYFSFLDGPITANNPMGVHHAWGRTYKDLWQRFYNMRGFKQRFQNGFDAQGLWVEVEVEKELGFKSKKDIEKYGIDKFVNKCKERVEKFAKIQTDQSKRLGYFMDWDNSYFTMSDENNYMIWQFLKTCFNNGWVYKGRDSVPWCPRCGTAISQHEMLTEDYAQLKHESVYFKLKIKSKKFKNTYLLAWTTTPWTIPANVAIAVNPEFTYGEWVKKDGNERLIFFEKASEKYNVKISSAQILGENRKGKYKKVKEYKGEELVGLKYIGGFDQLARVQKAQKEHLETFHTVVSSKELVTAEEGTAILHVAPGAGQEDFRLAKEKDLAVIEVIDEEAVYISKMDEFSGKNAKKQPQIIIKYLAVKNKGEFLFRTQKITHRYPRCWRCKTELVWRVVDEWYIAMDKPLKRKNEKGKIKNLTLRQRMINMAKTIKWIPEFGLERELDWLKNMHDWLISKKRYWGLALPIYECQKCGEFEVIGSKEELKKRAVKGWEKFNGHSPHRPWIDKIKIKCGSCGAKTERIKDVGNPWLDAGIVPYSTISSDNKSKPLYKLNKKEWKKWFPADFITESFPGQFKNWFYSLIAMSAALENKRPFKTILGFGTLLGEDGRAMHKSWGNSIEFNEGADKIGVDVMRWMYAKTDPKKNLLFGYKPADQTRRQFHLLLWNIYRFFVLQVNLSKWKPKERKTPQGVLDRWILAKMDYLADRVTANLENFNAQHAAEEIQKFTDDLSTWYVRRSRQREDIDVVLTVLHQTLLILTRVTAPFIPFLSDEIYLNITSGEESVHMADWPILPKSFSPDTKLFEEMDYVRKTCELAHAERKKAMIKVRQPLQKLKIKNEKSKIEFQNSKYLKDYEQLIKDELNIKEIEWVKGKKELSVELDAKITPELKEEGEARDIVRQIQIARKKADCKLDEKITVKLPGWPKRFESQIKKQTLAKRLIAGDKLIIVK